MAYGTSSIVLDNAAAFRAGAAFMVRLFRADVIAIGNHVVLDRLSHRIGAGSYAAVAET